MGTSGWVCPLGLVLIPGHMGPVLLRCTVAVDKRAVRILLKCFLVYNCRYPMLRTCIWNITAPVGERVVLNFTHFNVTPGREALNCQDDDFVIVNNGN